MPLLKEDKSCIFSVWAPYREKMYLLLNPDSSEETQVLMEKNSEGYHQITMQDIYAGTPYCFRVEGEYNRPDPASNLQLSDIHGPSVVVNHHSYEWEDTDFSPPSMNDMIIYELHAGTFSDKGTFEGVAERLPALKELGINTIELMPAAQFPGERNWGYDGALPYAVQNSYGGPEGLKNLVNSAHKIGMAVILDVVYNHLGPEGNYLGDFFPWYNELYKTPWGYALNFDGPESPGLRQFFIENALYWFKDYHIDGLRLDAVHAIYDCGAKHFLLDLSQSIKKWERERNILAEKNGAAIKNHLLIAESDLNDTRILNKPEDGGYDLHGQWSDDFHHALRSMITGESLGYYTDYGNIEYLEKAFSKGFVYDWCYSQARRRYHGSSSENIDPGRMVVFSHNHDQEGNSPDGTRLHTKIPVHARRLVAAAVLLSPYVPMLFMGEEYAEESPFLYFVSHGDQNLLDAVREGRRKEFEGFQWTEAPPDPGSEETFLKSRLNWDVRLRGNSGKLLAFYKELISIRSSHKAFKSRLRNLCAAEAANDKVLFFTVGSEESLILIVLNLSDSSQRIDHIPESLQSELCSFHKKNSTESSILSVTLKKLIDSQTELWGGSGSALPDSIRSNWPMELSPWQSAAWEIK